MKRQIVGDTKTESGDGGEINEPTILPAFARSIVTQKTKHSVVVFSLNVIIERSDPNSLSISSGSEEEVLNFLFISSDARQSIRRKCNCPWCICSVARCRELCNVTTWYALVGHAIGEFIGRIQRRVGPRIRSDAGGKQTAHRDGTHRPILFMEAGPFAGITRRWNYPA